MSRRVPIRGGAVAGSLLRCSLALGAGSALASSPDVPAQSQSRCGRG